LLKHKGRREPRKFGKRWINAFQIENHLSNILKTLHHYSLVPLSLNLGGEEVGRYEGKMEAQGMVLVPVL